MATELPRRIDRYNIISELGAGGMGRVYKAYDTNLKRDVVIKVIADTYLNDPEFLKRFEREAEIIANLNHPNILQVFDRGLTKFEYAWGRAPQEIPYFVLSYVEGDDLAKWIKQGRLGNNFEQTSQIISEVASALDYAYDNYQLVHRDIKPGNILLDSRHKNRVLLGDFGIAKLLQSGNSLTVNAIIGTPAYISPERVDPKDGQTLDGRSDQYSLAVVLYEMLTGVLPFQAAEPFTLAIAHVIKDVPNPSQYNRFINQAMIEVLNKALAKHPDDRYLTSTDFARNFEMAIKAHPASPQTVRMTPLKVDPTPPASDEALTVVAPVPPRATTHIEFELLKTLNGNSRWICSLAWSPDAQVLASVTDEKTIRLWNVAGTLLHTLQGHTDWVSSVAWSPDGKILATASADKTIRLWNVAGKLLNTLQGHSNKINSVAWSPAGQLLASASSDNTVKIWNNASGKLFHTLQGHSNIVWSVAWSHDSQMLASASYDNTIKLWNASGSLFNTLQSHSASVNSVAWSPDRQLLASASDDKTIKLWNGSGKLLNTLQGHTKGVKSVTWSPDGQFLASASDDKTIKLWNISGKLLNTLQGHTDSVNSVAWSPDKQLLASASEDDTIKLWKRI